MATTPLTKFTDKGKLVSSARAESSHGSRTGSRQPWNSTQRIRSMSAVPGHRWLDHIQRAPIPRPANQRQGAPCLLPTGAAQLPSPVSRRRKDMFPEREAAPASLSHASHPEHLVLQDHILTTARSRPGAKRSCARPAGLELPSSPASPPTLPRIKRRMLRSQLGSETQEVPRLSPNWDRRTSPAWDCRRSAAWGGVGFYQALTREGAELEARGWEETVAAAAEAFDTRVEAFSEMSRALLGSQSARMRTVVPRDVEALESCMMGFHTSRFVRK